MYLTFFLVVEYHNFPCFFENIHVLKDFPDLRTFLKEPVLAGFRGISHLIFLFQFFSISSRRKSKKCSRSHRSEQRSRWGVRELSTVDVLGGKMTLWDGDVQYVSNILVIYRRCFIIFN